MNGLAYFSENDRETVKPLDKMLIMSIAENNINCKMTLYIDHTLNSHNLYFRYLDTLLRSSRMKRYNKYN